MLRKLTRLNDILHNGDLIYAWLYGRLERQASHEELMAVFSALMNMTGLPPDSFRSPSWCKLRPIKATEVRVALPSGEVAYFDLEQQSTEILMPLAALEYTFPLVTHVIDRSSINSSAMYFAMHRGFMFQPFFDWFHSQWNCIKAACKHVGTIPALGLQKGYLWESIVQWLIVGNFNKGPFNSYQWFTAKQEYLQRWIDEHSVHSEDFQAFVYELAANLGLPTATLDDQQAIFDKLPMSRSFVERGPIIKLQRWFSIHDNFRFYEPEIPFLTQIHKMMANAAGGEGAGDLASGAAVGAGTVQGELQRASKGRNTIQLIPKILTPQLVHDMKLFVCITEACWKTWSVRIETVRSPDECLELCKAPGYTIPQNPPQDIVPLKVAIDHSAEPNISLDGRVALVGAL